MIRIEKEKKNYILKFYKIIICMIYDQNDYIEDLIELPSKIETINLFDKL